MVIILVGYLCLIVILILFQRFLNNCIKEGFETKNKEVNEEKDVEKKDIKSRVSSDIVFGQDSEKIKPIDTSKGKSNAQKELDKSMKINLVKEIGKKKNKQIMKKINNLPKYNNKTPKFHKPSANLYKAYGWTKIPPQSWSVIQKPPPKCISNTPNSDKPMHKFGFPLDQINKPLKVKLTNKYPNKKTGYFNMLKPVLLL